MTYYTIVYSVILDGVSSIGRQGDYGRRKYLVLYTISEKMI